MTINAEEKKDNIEKEKNIDMKGDISREKGYKNEITEDLGPVIVAAARESNWDHNEIQPTEEEAESEWDYDEDGENEDDNLVPPQALPLHVNKG